MIKGKIIGVNSSDKLISKGYHLADSHGKYIVEDRVFSLFSRIALTRRLFRAEITGYYTLDNGSSLIVAKNALFLKRHGSNCFVKCFSIPRGSKPLNLCIAPSGNVYFGEYFQNIEKQAVNIYKSSDGACTWNIVYTFAEGEINHIHGLFLDPFTDRIWVATGDRAEECIIGYTEDEFKSFNVVFRGGQEYRTCQMFFYKDYIVFGTDTQYEQNYIRSFDRKSLKITDLQQVQGSVIKGGQVGDVAFLSTTVEPSDVNKDQYAHLWTTKDGRHWEERYKAKKDYWPFIFQFGTFEFPNFELDKLDRLYFSGRALKGMNGKTTYIVL